MGTTAQKLNKLKETKTSIRTAIIAKHVEVPSDATFASYPYYISQISGGGPVPTGNIELQQQIGTDVTNYATASVKSGAVDNPVATKGSVSNHAITVTPNVNKSAAGWIDPGTLTGTGVSVSASELVSGSITLTQTAATDVTNYATATVQTGAAGTPSATKGTVSNNSISVTPKVTNSAGWINGGTLTGTAVTVSASELVSGSITLTQATATDVTNYASATVKTGSATTPATTKQQSTPTISVNSSTGLITANVAATSVSVTPTVSAGWVASGTAGTVTMSASSATSQLSTQGATTITPTESSQTAVAAGKYTTGAVTVGAISSTYVGTGVTRQAAKTVTPTTSAQTAVAANVYTTGAVTVAAIQTETKTVLENGLVTPTSGKYLLRVDVAVPIPAGCKWYGYRSWNASSLGANMFLQNERWTNNEGTTGIVIGDIIALEVTVTDKSNRISYLLIKVTGMDGTTAIGNGIGVVEKYQEASPTITSNTIYRTGTGTPSATLGNDGDLYLDLNS